MISRLSLSHSLNARVTLFTLSVFVLSLWTLSFYTSHMLAADMQRMLGEQQFQTASRVAAEVNDELVTRMAALELIAKEIDANLIANPVALRARLEQRPILSLLFNGCTWVSANNGIVAASNLPVCIDSNNTHREYLRTVLKEGNSVISEPTTGQVLKDPIFVMAVPIRDATGKVVGAIVGVTDLSTANFLDRSAKGQYGKNGGFYLIAPKNRLIVAVRDRTRVMQSLPPPGINPLLDRYLQGHEGYGVSVSSLGVEELSAAKSIPIAGWLMSVVIPTSEAFAPVYDMLRRMREVTLLLTVLTAGLTWWMLKRQLTPMLRTTRTLARMATNEQPARALPVANHDEIGAMVDGFNHLLETIERQHEALRVSEDHFHAIFDASPVPMALNDALGNMTLLNKAFGQVIGYGLKDIPTLSDWWTKAYPDPQYRQQVADNWGKNLALATRSGAAFPEMEVNIRCKDNSVRSFQVSGSVLNERVNGTLLAVLYDVTERKQIAVKISELGRDFVSFLENTSDFIYFKDRHSRFRFCSQTLAKITGHASWRDMIGKHDLEVFPPETATIYSAEELPIFREGKPLLNKIDPYFDATGKPGWVNTSKWPLMDEDGQVVGLFGISRDITEQHQIEADRDVMQEKIRFLAFVDPLTQLPNRRLLDDRLSQALATSKRSGRYGALMFLDLDNFKPLNDQQGHGVGDLLLVEVARRLTNCVRESDSVARLGGDEFVVLLSELDTDQAQSTKQAGAVAEKIRLALAACYQLTVKPSQQQGKTVVHHCSASIGVVVFLDHEASPTDLMKWADAAMYQAKDAGRNSVQFYVSDVPAKALT